jgi:hypothetical protein
MTSDFIGVGAITACAWIYPRAFTGFHGVIGNDQFIFGLDQGTNAIDL